MGRPTIKTAKVMARVCNRLAIGIPLAEICRDRAMPCTTTVREWIAQDEVFSVRIARAREDGFDALAARVLRIARRTKKTKRFKYERDAKGKLVLCEKIVEDNTQRDRLEIDTTLKLLSKWDPKRYGELIKIGDPNAQVLNSPEFHIHAAVAPRRSKADG